MVGDMECLPIILNFSCFIEELTLCSFKEVKDSWEKEYDILVTSLIEEDLPCYVLYRFYIYTYINIYICFLLKTSM